MKKHFGIIAALLSAVLFGITPIMGRLSYEGGSNGTTLAFLRTAFSVPVLFVILKLKGISLKISLSELRDILLIGILGSGMTIVLLYSSYQYIPVGIATVLHFFYPTIVTLVSLVINHENHEHPSPLKLIAMFLGLCGVVLFFEPGGSMQ